MLIRWRLQRTSFIAGVIITWPRDSLQYCGPAWRYLKKKILFLKKYETLYLLFYFLLPFKLFIELIDAIQCEFQFWIHAADGEMVLHVDVERNGRLMWLLIPIVTSGWLPTFPKALFYEYRVSAPEWARRLIHSASYFNF